MAEVLKIITPINLCVCRQAGLGEGWDETIKAHFFLLRKETHKFYLNLRYKEEKEQKVFEKKFIE